MQDDTKRELINDYGLLESEFGCNALESFRSAWPSIGLYEYNYLNSGHSVTGWNYFGGRHKDWARLVNSPTEFYVPPTTIEDENTTSQTLFTCMVYNAADAGFGWESVSPIRKATARP